MPLRAANDLRPRRFMVSFARGSFEVGGAASDLEVSDS